MAKFRGFIALDIKAFPKIIEFENEIKNSDIIVKPVEPENIHITLKFLGNIKEADTKKVDKTIFESVKGYKPISLKAKGIGVFPSIKKPRVIWTGISDQLNLMTELQKRLDEKLEEIGFPKEKRPFRGHLTLGRVKAKIDPIRLSDALKEFATFESESFSVDRVILYKSELEPKGAVYTKMANVLLAGAK